MVLWYFQISAPHIRMTTKAEFTTQQFQNERQMSWLSVFTEMVFWQATQKLVIMAYQLEFHPGSPRE